MKLSITQLEVESFNMREAFPFDSFSSDVIFVRLLGIQPYKDSRMLVVVAISSIVHLQRSRFSKILFFCPEPN